MTLNKCKTHCGSDFGYESDIHRGTRQVIALSVKLGEGGFGARPMRSTHAHLFRHMMMIAITNSGQNHQPYRTVPYVRTIPYLTVLSYVRTYVRTYLLVRTSTYVPTYVHTYMHTYIHTYIHTHSLSLYIYIYIYYVYTYTYIQIIITIIIILIVGIIVI